MGEHGEALLSRYKGVEVSHGKMFTFKSTVSTLIKNCALYNLETIQKFHVRDVYYCTHYTIYTSYIIYIGTMELPVLLVLLSRFIIFYHIGWVLFFRQPPLSFCSPHHGASFSTGWTSCTLPWQQNTEKGHTLGVWNSHLAAKRMCIESFGPSANASPKKKKYWARPWLSEGFFKPTTGNLQMVFPYPQRL